MIKCPGLEEVAYRVCFVAAVCDLFEAGTLCGTHYPELRRLRRLRLLPGGYMYEPSSGVAVGAPGSPRGGPPKGLHGEYLFLLGGEELVYLLHELVVELLGLGLGVLLHVLGHALLDGLLELVYGLAAGVAH